MLHIVRQTPMPILNVTLPPPYTGECSNVTVWETDGNPAPVCCDGVCTILVITFGDGGESFNLTYNVATNQWEGTGTACGEIITATFYCYNSPWWLLNITTSRLYSPHIAEPTSCSNPFTWVSDRTYDIGNCTGININITDNGCSGISTTCCSNLLPDFLCAVITDKTGDCSCLPDLIVLEYDELAQQWKGGNSVSPDCIDIDLTFSCSSGGDDCFDFRLDSTRGGFSIFPDSCSCSPFNIVYTKSGFGSACTGSATITITTGCGVSTACCGIDTSAILYGTFSNATGTCTCLPTEVILIYSESQGQWRNGGGGTSCTDIDLTLQCLGNIWEVTSGWGQFLRGATTVNCNPFSLFYDTITFNAGCSGTVDLTITD